MTLIRWDSAVDDMGLHLSLFLAAHWFPLEDHRQAIAMYRLLKDI